MTSWRTCAIACGLAPMICACPVAAAAQIQAAQSGPAPTPAVQAAAGKTAGSTPAPRHEPWQDVAFGLTFEGYYEVNTNRPEDRVNALRAYDTRANTFSIQQVATIVELAPAPGNGRRYGVRLDLQFGQATESVQGSPSNEPRPAVYRNVWQAYGSYVIPAGRGLQVDFGKFASNLGCESNYAKDNQAFTRAFLFNFLPFYHMGVRATLPVNDRVTVLGTVTNGIQQTEDFNNFKSGELSVTVKPIARVSWTVNYYAGREQPDQGQPNGPDGLFTVFDTYATAALSRTFTATFDVNRTSNEFSAGRASLSLVGVGAYARAQVRPNTALGVRYERLDDEGLFASVKQVLQEITVTAEQKLADGLLVRGEYRHDWSDAAFFPSRDATLGGRQPTFLLSAIWWFGNKTGTW